MTTPFRNVAVIINPAAGNNEPVLNTVNDVFAEHNIKCCLLYTSDAADERSSVDLGGRRIIKKKKQLNTRCCRGCP